MNWKSIWQGVVGTVAAALILLSITAFTSTQSRTHANESDIAHLKQSFEADSASKDKQLSEIKANVEELSKLRSDIAALNANVEWMKELARRPATPAMETP